MEWAQAEVVFATTFKLHVIADDIEYVGGFANALDSIFRYSGHDLYGVLFSLSQDRVWL